MKEKRMKKLLTICIIACPFLLFTGLVLGYRSTVGEPYYQSHIKTPLKIVSVIEKPYKLNRVYYFYLEDVLGNIKPYRVIKAAVEGTPKPERWIIPIFEGISKSVSKFVISDSSPDLPSTEN